MHSKQSLEGYYLIDHHDSPGLPEAIAVKAGLPPNATKGHTTFESASITCHGCHALVILNPDRSRPRNYCKRHDHYLCDACAARLALSTEPCVSMNEQIEMIRHAAEAALVTDALPPSDVFQSPMIPVDQPPPAPPEIIT